MSYLQDCMAHLDSIRNIGVFPPPVMERAATIVRLLVDETLVPPNMEVLENGAASELLIYWRAGHWSINIDICLESEGWYEAVSLRPDDRRDKCYWENPEATIYQDLRREVEAFSHFVEQRNPAWREHYQNFFVHARESGQ